MRARPTRALLDRDPITGAQITWRQGEDHTLVLTEQSDAFETVMVYDGRSGVLIAYQQTVELLAVTTTVTLALAE